LQQVLEDENIRPEAVDIIRSLIDRIEVHPGPARVRCEVAVVGALAQILAFAQQESGGSPSSARSSTFLMVAGLSYYSRNRGGHTLRREMAFTRSGVRSIPLGSTNKISSLASFTSLKNASRLTPVSHGKFLQALSRSAKHPCLMM
jgi:hypothetical protein